MKYPRVPLIARAVFALIITSTAGLFAQLSPTVIDRSDNDATQKSNIVVLSPFDVAADKDNSYGALNSNSVTRFNVELDKLPVTADIFNQAFMDDVGASTVEDMLQTYSSGSGSSSTDPATNAGQQYNDHVAHTVIQLRGFDTTVIQRDSLMPSGPMYNPGATAPGMTTNFDLERVEVVNGPQALLYSGGGPGGVVNSVSKMARFNTKSTGSLKYTIDQYGTKMGLFDYNTGTDKVAIRLAVLKDDQQSRRVNVGQEITGNYLQIALKLFKNTTIRLIGDETTEHGILGGDMTFTSSNTTADSRSGDKISYLIATNQLGANTLNAAGVPNASGSIWNGRMNWAQDGAMSGWLKSEETITKYTSFAADTVWNSHISSELAFGYTTSYYGFRSVGTTLYAPQATANPTGDWAIGGAPNETTEPAHTKALRYSMVFTNDLFGGRAHSQTIIGADYIGARAYSISFAMFQADANYNPIYSSSISTYNGRTNLATQYYSIGQGSTMYPFYSLEAPRTTLNGVNYVRQQANQINTSLISPANPLGLSSTNLNEHSIIDNKGAFLVNFTQWMDGKLNTLVGIRPNENFDSLVLYPPNPYRVSRVRTIDYDVGADYALTNWLKPYFSASDSVTPPQVNFPDPAGHNPTAGRGTGVEAGFKFNNKLHTLSGALAFYSAIGKNEQYNTPTGVTTAVNPVGLNGSVGNGSYAEVDRKSTGFDITLTANPLPNWRIRFSAAEASGKINTTVAYPQLYNDQFRQNTSGQVTYADGTLVYVGATYNSKSPVVTSTTSGAVPLTLAMMNSSTSPYYANPTSPSGAISSTSAVATVLKTVDAVHGSILTGAIGLPITSLQITPSFTVPGVIQAFAAGQKTAGYPQYSMAFTNIYTFSTGFLKGFNIGGTISGQYKRLIHYYLPVSGSTNWQTFYAPNRTQVDLIAGYSRKFKKITWKSQVNIANLFNHYSIVIQPSVTNGYTAANNLSAAFYGQPRLMQWSNTFSF